LSHGSGDRNSLAFLKLSVHPTKFPSRETLGERLAFAAVFAEDVADQDAADAMLFSQLGGPVPLSLVQFK
jgi:hypothetical protein